VAIRLCNGDEITLVLQDWGPVYEAVPVINTAELSRVFAYLA